MAEDKKDAPKIEKVVITPELRRIWLTARRTWVTSFDSFSNSLSALSTKQANMLYDVVRHSIFKSSYAEILRLHPELKEFLHSDEDRLCMHDIYEVLSWRLERKEKPPSDVKLTNSMNSSIGRGSPNVPIWGLGR